jgi:hypothetical protein
MSICLLNDEEIIDTLLKDTALTLAQVRRWVLPGEPEEEVRRRILRLASTGALVVFPAWVPPTARSRRLARVEFVLLRDRELPPASLRHVCGIAEMRHMLLPGLLSWKPLAPHALIDTGEPDALGEDPLGVFAVEYDAGSYTPEQVARKAEAYRSAYGRQVWGAPTSPRAAWLRSLVPDAEVLHAPWF